MKHSLNFVRSALLLAALPLSVLSGCIKPIEFPNPPAALSASETSGPLARVIFTRTSSMLGAAVEHTVLDLGDGIPYDVQLVVGHPNTDPKGNYDRGMNVQSVSSKSETAAGLVDLSAISGAGARTIGVVGSGDSLEYLRPAGVMKLTVVTPLGDQAFAPWTTVQAGRTYRVTYSYASADFEVKEVSKQD